MIIKGYVIIVMVTPKPGYNEYIIEREKYILQKPW